MYCKLDGVSTRPEECLIVPDFTISVYNVRLEMKCSVDSEILHGLVHDTTLVSSCFADFRYYHELIRVRVVPRNQCCPGQVFV